MKFQKYSSIENSYRQLFIDKIIGSGLSGGKWCVQEKIHGANFSIYITKKVIMAAKRSGFIKSNESFYNYQGVLIRYDSNIEDFFTISMAKEVVVLRCEFFGGSYNHKDVKPVTNASKVQKGVFYCPQNEFIVFDAEVDGEVLPIWNTEYLCANSQIPFIPILFEGTFEKCLEYKNDFQTGIPDLFNLPEIEDNICEGIVIKPIIPVFLNCGSRVILKSKNEKFSEKNKEPKPLPEPLSEELQTILSNASKYINENRLRNVLSKIGPVTNKDFGKILGMFVKDAIEDFIKDDNVMESLEKSDRKRINKLINTVAANLIRPNFLNIIDGTF